MIKSVRPLFQFVEEFRDAGLDVGVFPTKHEDKLAIRVVDPDEPGTGLSVVASFANKLEEAKLTGDRNKDIEKQDALDAMLQDNGKMARYIACFCIVDEKSVRDFPDRFTADDIGNTFNIITVPSTAQKLTREDVTSAAESSSDNAPAKKITRSRSRK